MLQKAAALLPSPPVALIRWFLLLLAAVACQAAVTAEREFDLAPGEAAQALKQFAEQAGREIMFPAEPITGVRTNAVKGLYAPRAALDRMLANTALIVVEDAKTGALMVNCAPHPGAPSQSNPQSLTPSEPRRTMNSRKKIIATVGSWLALFLAPAPAQVASTAAAAPAAKSEKSDEVVVLTPFEVTANSKGYYATNTMSGTRLNSKLEDLAASISVVTKEQLTDFALIDINDIFSYESNTEGTGNYTSFAFDSNGTALDTVQQNPQGNNRIRGIGPANTTIGNFSTSLPIDPIAIESVEISRGPNASIFGIGSAAGTVNMVPTSANLTRNHVQVGGRIDNTDGYRNTLDVNRVLIKNVLAIRGSAVVQQDGFERKPSGTDTLRFNGMVKYRPFKATTISAAYGYFDQKGTRANAILPRDGITGWKASGSPTWDPVTSTLRVNGVVAGTFPTTVPTVFGTVGFNWTQFYIDQGGLTYMQVGRYLPTTTQTARLMGARSDPTGFLSAQPLFPDYPTLSPDKSIYDWSSINLASANYFEQKGKTATVLIDQEIFRTSRQTLDVQLGWYREDTGGSYDSNPVGASQNANSTPILSLDVNERNLDGTPNPYFLRPFIGVVNPDMITAHPLSIANTYRAQAAYSLRFSDDKNWRRWLGNHQVSTYAEYKDRKVQTITRRLVITDNYPGVAAGVESDRPYLRFYLGDNNGGNVDYGSTGFSLGQYALNWRDPVKGATQTQQVGLTEPVLATPVIDGLEASITKSRGAILQSNFLNDHVVTTFGVRHDEQYNLGQAPGKGPTRTAGIVVKPFSWLSLFANKSDSFVPASLAFNLHAQPLPFPTGKGEDYGFMLNLLQGKLVVKTNIYRTEQLNARNGIGGTLSLRVLRLDLLGSGSSQVFQLQPKATQWVVAAATAKGQTLSSAEVDQQVADLMKLPVSYMTFSSQNTIFAGSDDLLAKGKEIEVYYNPTDYWTVKLNVTQQESINSKISSELQEWIAERVPVWQSIIDPTTNQPWFTDRYGGSRSAKEYLEVNVTTPLGLAMATQGKSSPQVRKYRANFSTNFRLAGITEHRILKRFNVGVALRWEDKAAIGYYGIQQPPAIVTDLDPNRPIYDKAHLYVDAFVGYRTDLFSDKIKAKFQLNVRDLTEGGRLQVIAADPSGGATGYRIIDPRQFILSVTFDL